MARGFIAVMLFVLMGAATYSYVLSTQLTTAHKALENVRDQMEGLQRQITDLDEPILKDSPKELDLVDTMTEEQRAAYVLSMLQREDAARKAGDASVDTVHASTVDAGAGAERDAEVAIELVETQDALQNMKLLYKNVHARIDALLKERERLMRENQILRNEIRRLRARLPQYPRVGDGM